MLRLANSAYFGLKRKVDSFDRAVTLLGSRFLLEMALFSMTAEMFGAPQADYALTAGELRRHAMVSAAFARELAKLYGLKRIETVFTAALINDIGKTIFNHHLQKDPVVAPREICVICLADTICSMFGFGAGKDGLHSPFSDEILLRCFDIRNLHGIMARLLACVDKLDALMRDF